MCLDFGWCLYNKKCQHHVSVSLCQFYIRFSPNIKVKESVIPHPITGIPQLCVQIRRQESVARRQMDRLTEKEQEEIIKQRYLTCKAKGTFAGILRGRCWLICCNACCPIQTAVWLYLTGITHILTIFSNPTWGTNTLQECRKLFIRSVI